ncbi:MAG: glycosyltransferase [Firmicutes bacterium]|nr:glycosyltransferase [Bacillota bacterium]
MRILVFDVPAERGGALTILEQYYEKAIVDSKNEWIFVISKPELESKKNVKIINYPWVKKSWMHRLIFDIFVAHKLVSKYNIDEVISLQNILIPNITVKQTLYVHQSLPFIDYKFRFLENKSLWIYQNIIGNLIYMSVKKADCILVQTNWMKNACLKKINVDGNKILVVTPEIGINVMRHFKHSEDSIRTFFYPAGASYYKNHRIIVDAFNKLNAKGIDNIKVIFTLKGNENAHIAELYETTKLCQLNINFIGSLTKEEVFNHYSKSVLIFPSYIETFGLPLLEAKMHNTPILASDCEFSHEILEDYNKVDFFNPFDSTDLVSKIIELIKNKSND